MSARVGAEHAGAGCAGAAQPLAARLLLLLEALVPQQPPQEDQVRHQTGEGAGVGSRAYTSTFTRAANLKVRYFFRSPSSLLDANYDIFLPLIRLARRICLLSIIQWECL